MIKRLNFLALLIIFVYSSGLADEFQEFDKYSVHYTVFNSTFVKPNIAAIHGIKRSQYENLINISVVPKGEYGGLPAKVWGTTTNLMQQQKQLKFIEIKEETATYYLAPVPINNKEVIHFDLNVTPDGEKDPLNLTFTKTIYAEK